MFRSLVISSALLLGPTACQVSHERVPPDPPPPPDPDGGLDDAGFAPSDAGTHPVDAGRGRASDAGAPDAGPPPDAGAPDPRACEPGWPTTKAFFCTTFDEDRVLCCNSTDEPEDCCLQEQP